MSEPRPPGKLEAILALVSTAVMAWCVMPPQERMWLKLSVLRSLHQASARLAFREGRRGMGDELAGRDFQRYEVAYWASCVRDRIERALRDMRP